VDHRPPAFADALLTRDSRQRLRLVHSGLASLLMAGAVALMHYMTAAGLNDGRGLWLWTVTSLAGVVGMFVLIRSGWSQRLKDPSLTVAQMLYAIACSAAAYGIAGRGQGAALLMLTVALMFGVFGMSRRQAWLIGGYTTAVFGAVMAWCAYSNPVAYPLAVQVTHFAMIGIFVVGLLAVAARLGAMRARMRRQRAELTAALERISDMATLDDLTGLLNRRRMGELLEAERERSLRSGHAWGVAILDIDHFKRVNDAFGHAAGDAVLRAVATVGMAAIRRCDSLARWGGEEFVLLLRDVDPAGASIVASRMREALRQERITVEGAAVEVTASIGVALHRPGEPIDATMSRADRALYAAKAGGRDRVVTEDHVQVGMPPPE
jgi:diguanylate cyclase (GGDEF)-like protein